tara:strand:+ start:416 stop:1474 length:1059 start_codon:yes stop_codon:yes gene_type:complete
MPASRSALLAPALILVGLLCSDARADGERPLGNLLRDARAAKTLQKLAGTSYYEGGRGRTSVVEHTLEVDERGLTSVFVEHLKTGGAIRTRYRLNLTGLLESISTETATPEGYPSYTPTSASKREGQELVTETPAQRAPLPEDATPMPVMMFVLPRLLIHLPETLELTPVHGKRALPSGFQLRRHEAKGDEVPIEVLAADKTSIMKIFVSGAEQSLGQLLRLEARKETIRPLSAAEAKRHLEALRTQSKAQPSPGFESPQAAVEGLIAACAAGDLGAAGACFSAKAPREFQSLRDGSASPKSFQQLCQLFAGATTGEVKTQGERAEVAVKLASRAELLTVVKEQGRWRILDF